MINCGRIRRRALAARDGWTPSSCHANSAQPVSQVRRLLRFFKRRRLCLLELYHLCKSAAKVVFIIKCDSARLLMKTFVCLLPPSRHGILIGSWLVGLVGTKREKSRVASNTDNDNHPPLCCGGRPDIEMRCCHYRAFMFIGVSYRKELYVDHLLHSISPRTNQPTDQQSILDCWMLCFRCPTTLMY